MCRPHNVGVERLVRMPNPGPRFAPRTGSVFANPEPVSLNEIWMAAHRVGGVFNCKFCTRRDGKDLCPCVLSKRLVLGRAGAGAVVIGVVRRR